MEDYRKIIKVVREEDCPKCGYPELVYVKDAQTLEPIFKKCGNEKCNWQERIIKDNKKQ